jgi:DNA-binding XRE family transcriptional regulator
MSANVTEAPVYRADFGPIIKRFRRLAGVTQRELASAAQISERRLRRIETGEHVLNVWAQCNLAGELGSIMGARSEARAALA